ncbi:MAG: hypothetical protein ACERKD_24390 [Prolixibacteraceae bacterium]
MKKTIFLTLFVFALTSAIAGSRSLEVEAEPVYPYNIDEDTDEISGTETAGATGFTIELTLESNSVYSDATSSVSFSAEGAHNPYTLHLNNGIVNTYASDYASLLSSSVSKYVRTQLITCNCPNLYSRATLTVSW